MRILALYDIHGNVEALDAVLADPRAAGPDAIVVGGDAVPGAVRGRGARPPGGAARARRTGCAATASARSPRSRRPPPSPSTTPTTWPSSTAILNARTLGASARRRSATLPLTVELDGILFCHATPRSDEEILTRASTPERYAAALAGVAQPLVVAGHTHQQDDRTVGATRFVNAGSVGLPYEGDGAARWLWIEDGVPELRQTAYDHAGAGRRILEAGWPDAQSTAAAMTEPLEARVITELFEERATA